MFRNLNMASCMLDLNISGLQEAVGREVSSLIEDPPSKDDIVSLEKASDASRDIVHALNGTIKHMVAQAYASRVVNGAQEHVLNATENSCLKGMKIIQTLGAGADGVVYELEGGKVAKISYIDISSENEIPGNLLEMALMEIAACTVAGKYGYGPIVHKSWFCFSSWKTAYIIVMDKIVGTTLSSWTKGKSESDMHQLYNRVHKMNVSLMELGIYHNDMHKGNVMVDYHGRPWIIDYSRCTFLDVLTKYRTKFSELPQLTKNFTSQFVPHRIDKLAHVVLARLIQSGEVRITT